MKKFKNEKGITLVALVVTIIVLIILAGISINLILGDNGIITIAKKAKENIELARVEEETQLNELYTQLESNNTGSGGTNYDAIAKLTEFKTAIANAIGEAGGIRPDTTAETAVFADNIKGIVKEVTKDATATADNISEGKTAWVNGMKIVGTGLDNNSYYEKGKSEISASELTIIIEGQYLQNGSGGIYHAIYGFATIDVTPYSKLIVTNGNTVTNVTTNTEYSANTEYDISTLTGNHKFRSATSSTSDIASTSSTIKFYN